MPQTENVFTLMSIADNLRLAADMLPKPERASQIEAMYALFPDLARQRQLAAGRLSGGQRQMLAVARALIAKPRILMLDEASAGLSPKLVGEVFAKLVEIRAAGITILMVEQNAKAALAIADRAMILAEGRTVHEGPSAEIARDPCDRPPLSRCQTSGRCGVNLQFLADGLIMGALIGLGAIGVTLTYSILGFANFAHGEFIAWGTYIALALAGAIGAATRWTLRHHRPVVLRLAGAHCGTACCHSDRCAGAGA